MNKVAKETEREPESEVFEPGGRKHQLVELMSSEDIAAAYADAVRLRAHELSETLDRAIGNWMHDARKQLSKRGDLEMIRTHLAVYFDPSRKSPVFGPGGKLASQAAIERAIQQAKPPLQIAAR
ncbi:MAG: hypothetical protein WB622_17550 [Acidobacteriaceae bacterium]